MIIATHNYIIEFGEQEIKTIICVLEFNFHHRYVLRKCPWIVHRSPFQLVQESCCPPSTSEPEEPVCVCMVGEGVVIVCVCVCVCVCVYV